jgi:hypothetical protein
VWLCFLQIVNCPHNNRTRGVRTECNWIITGRTATQQMGANCKHTGSDCARLKAVFHFYVICALQTEQQSPYLWLPAVMPFDLSWLITMDWDENTWPACAMSASPLSCYCVVPLSGIKWGQQLSCIRNKTLPQSLTVFYIIFSFHKCWHLIKNKPQCFLAVFWGYLILSLGHAVAQLVQALRYKPEGRGFDSQQCHWNYSMT